VLQDLQLTDRVSYDAERNILFANFEGMTIQSADDVECVRRVFDALCSKVGRRVALIVNYDGFQFDESLADTYFEMVADLQAKHYTTTTRYTTSAFMRMKLGEALFSRHAAAHVERDDKIDLAIRVQVIAGAEAVGMSRTAFVASRLRTPGR
jgi:propionate CoA-transferase